MLKLSKDFNLKEWISAILLLQPKDFPMLSRAERWSEVESDTVAFYTTKQLARKSNVVSAVAIDWTSVTVPNDFAKRLTVWYLLMVGEEVVKVTAVWEAGETNTALTVVRWYGSTVAAAIAQGAEIKILSKAESEYEITEDFKTLDKVRSENIVQTFTKSVYVSKDAAAFQKKDYVDMLNEERSAKVQELGEEMNTTLYYGRKFLSATDTRRSMGGWKQAIMTDGWKVVDANGNLSKEDFELALSDVATKGWRPEAIFLNHSTFARLNVDWKDFIVNHQENINGMAVGGIIKEFVSASLWYALPFIIDDDINTGDLFVGKWRPVIHVMKDKEFGNDILFSDYREPTNSQVIQETIKSVITAEFRNAYQDMYVSNVLAGKSAVAPTKVIVENTTEAPVNTKEVTA